MANFKPWFGFDNIRFKDGNVEVTPYSGPEPAFYNPDDYAWVKNVENNWEAIKAELKPLMHDKNDELNPYFASSVQSKPNAWRTFGFYFWGRTNNNNCKKYPVTNSVLRSIPGMVGASFNLLEANAEILPHRGDTNAIIRCHLGLVIPAGLPACGFTVAGETQPWQQGKFIMFCDAYTHHAFNHTPERRYVLLIDVLRPEFRHKKMHICTRVLAGLTVHEIISKYPRLFNYFNPIYALLKWPLALVWRANLITKRVLGMDEKLPV